MVHTYHGTEAAGEDLIGCTLSADRVQAATGSGGVRGRPLFVGGGVPESGVDCQGLVVICAERQKTNVSAFSRGEQCHSQRGTYWILVVGIQSRGLDFLPCFSPA